MGFGLGAAIGAQVGNPDKRVIHIAGDGCFRMNCNELCTVEHYNLPIITVVFNNGTLGMVRPMVAAGSPITDFLLKEATATPASVATAGASPAPVQYTTTTN